MDCGCNCFGIAAASKVSGEGEAGRKKPIARFFRCAWGTLVSPTLPSLPQVPVKRYNTLVPDIFPVAPPQVWSTSGRGGEAQDRETGRLFNLHPPPRAQSLPPPRPQSARRAGAWPVGLCELGSGCLWRSFVQAAAAGWRAARARPGQRPPRQARRAGASRAGASRLRSLGRGRPAAPPPPGRRGVGGGPVGPVLRHRGRRRRRPLPRRPRRRRGGGGGGEGARARGCSAESGPVVGGRARAVSSAWHRHVTRRRARVLPRSRPRLHPLLCARVPGATRVGSRVGRRPGRGGGGTRGR